MATDMEDCGCPEQQTWVPLANGGMLTDEELAAAVAKLEFQRPPTSTS